MMRKIVISQVVPKCIASGYQTRALQLLNMADNRLLNFVGKHLYSIDDTIVDWGNSPRICYSWFKRNYYRADDDARNDYDYSNDFFINLDSLGVEHIERLAVRMQKPLCAFDRFLNERSYTNMEYLYEIIGTQLLAAMRYKEAIHYLSQVSDEFMQTTNVYPYLQKERQEDKLDFAKKMAALEQHIRKSKNPDDRAEHMLTFARELQNSIGPHWYLTRYYSGHWVCYPFYSQYQTDLYDHAIKKFEYLKHKAFETFTDAERAAKACYDWSLYKTAATKYPQTETAEYIRGNCDVLPIIKTLQIKICTKILKTLTDGDTTKNSYVILKLTNNETNHYNLFYMSVIRHNISPCRKRQLHTENTGKTTGIHNRFQIPSPGVRMLCRHVQIQSHRLSWLFNTRYPLFQKIHPPHKRLYSQGDTCPER